MRFFSDTSPNRHRPGAVVCGVDGSRVALEALRTARGLAGSLELRLVAAHVVAPAAVVAEARTVGVPSLGADDLASGEALLDRVCAEAQVLDAERRVAVGRAAERLAELADEERAELIVVGSRGHRLLRAAFIGGVSSELIGLANCPVLVIPAQALPWGRVDS